MQLLQADEMIRFLHVAEQLAGEPVSVEFQPHVSKAHKAVGTQVSTVGHYRVNSFCVSHEQLLQARIPLLPAIVEALCRSMNSDTTVPVYEYNINPLQPMSDWPVIDGARKAPGKAFIW